MSKSSTDGFSAKEKKTFQDMLVNKFFSLIYFCCRACTMKKSSNFHSKTQRSCLKDIQIILVNILSKHNDVFRIKRDEGTDFVWHGPLSGCYRLDKENTF